MRKRTRLRPHRYLFMVAAALISTGQARLWAANERPVRVTIHVDGGDQTVSVPAGSKVDAALDAANIVIGDLDRVTPARNSTINDSLKIVVVRVQIETERKRITLPRSMEIRYSDKLRAGERKILSNGRDGVAEQLTEVWYRDGRPTLRQYHGTQIVRQPENRIVLIGGGSPTVSRGGINARKVLTMEATGYSPDASSCGRWANGRTSLGLVAQYGVVAVDPSIIPLGTRVFVEGYGFAIAGDVGGAIKGLKIDLCHDTHKRALAVGRKKVKVYILD